jgi:hypothetical protein
MHDFLGPIISVGNTSKDLRGVEHTRMTDSA